MLGDERRQGSGSVSAHRPTVVLCADTETGAPVASPNPPYRRTGGNFLGSDVDSGDSVRGDGERRIRAADTTKGPRPCQPPPPRSRRRSRPDHPRHPVRRATVVSGVAAAVATTAVAAVAGAADVPLAIDGESIPLFGFAQMTLLGAVVGGLLVTMLNRYSTRRRSGSSSRPSCSRSCPACRPSRSPGHRHQGHPGCDPPHRCIHHRAGARPPRRRLWRSNSLFSPT